MDEFGRNLQNIIEAMNALDVAKYRLQVLREDECDGLMKDVEMFCRAKNIQVPNMDDPVNSELRQKRDRQVVTNLHHFRVEIYYEVLDLIAQELEKRFPEISTELLTCISCLDPRNSFCKFDLGKLVHLAELYPDDFSQIDCRMISQELQNYIYSVRRNVEFSAIQDVQSLSKKMVATGKSQVFPKVYRLIELALLLPVATATVERAFSAMHFVKTDLRNRMGDEWLNDSLVVYIEKNIFLSIDDETILQCFQNMQRRRILLPPSK